MLETDIGRKCTLTLAGVVLLVLVSVLASWRVASPRSGAGGAANPADLSPPVLSDIAPGPALTARPVAPDSEPVPEVRPAETAPGQDGMARKAFQLELENARLHSRLDDMLNWILDNVRGTFPLPEGQMANLRLVPVDEDMAVSADLAQLLRLNDEEINRLDKAFIGTKSILQDIEAENISVEAPAENQVVLSIPPYAEEGQLLRAELYGELKKTLGAARFDRFLQVAEDGLEEKFEYFGEADRSLQFEAFLDETSGASQLFVRDERVVPGKDNPLRQNITAFEQIVTELPAEYYPYWNWLPDYVTRFARSN